MAAKKSSPKTAPPAKRNPNAFEVVEDGSTTSQALAKLATTSVLSAVTLKRYSGAGDALEVPDLVIEMRKAGDEVVEGNMGRVERMLANQAMTLDAIFNDMAQRSGRQDTYKGIEVLMRLALKAQSQARATAETLALMKNPMPFIKQANIAHGPQQVNNGVAQVQQERDCKPAHAKQKTVTNELLGVEDGKRLDSRAQEPTSLANPRVATVEEVHRAKVVRGASKGSAKQL